MSQQHKSSDFKVQPDPPQQGQDVEVTYTGPETTVYWQVDGGKAVPVKVPKNKKFKIDKKHLNGRYLFLTTKKGWPGFLMAEIDKQ